MLLRYSNQIKSVRRLLQENGHSPACRVLNDSLRWRLQEQIYSQFLGVGNYSGT